MRRIQIGSLFDKIRHASKRKKISLIVALTVLVLSGIGLAAYLSRPNEAPKQEAAVPPNCFAIASVGRNTVPINPKQAYEYLKGEEAVCTSVAGVDAKAVLYVYNVAVAFAAFNNDDVEKNVSYNYANKAKEQYDSMSEKEKEGIVDRPIVSQNLYDVLSAQKREEDGQ